MKLAHAFGLMIVASLHAAALVQAADFPGYRGPDRNGIARADVGLADDWSKLPGGKPQLLWQTDDLGVIGVDHTNGQIAVADGLVYAVTYKDNKRLLSCYTVAGQPQWSLSIENTPYNGQHAGNPTPWIENRKVYIHGNKEDYCLNAKTGQVVWKTERRGNTHASPIVADGIHVNRAGGVYVGKKAETGAEVWRYVSKHNTGTGGSCAIWRTPGKTYFILPADEANDYSCADPATGKILWTLDPPGDGNDGVVETTPMVLGDTLVMSRRTLDAGADQVCYKLYPDEPAKAPTLLWATPDVVKSSGVIHQGLVYWGYTNRTRTFAGCFDAVKGAKLWWVDNPAELPGGPKGYGDLLLADGKLFGNACMTTVMSRPDPQGFKPLSSDRNNANHMTAPTIVDGKMYILSFDGYSNGGEQMARIKCFDVAAPPGSKPVICQRGLPGAAIGSWYCERLWVSGGNGLRVWSVAAGELPPGLKLDGNAHTIAGRPNKAGRYTFTLEVQDHDADKQSKQFVVEIKDAPGQ